MKRKLLSILLTLCLAFSLLPTAALADEGKVAKVGDTEYMTLQAAIDAASSGATVKLLADINTPTTSYVISKSLTIDLNGKTITADGYDSVFAIEGEGNHVVINATNGGKVIAVENSGSAGQYAMAVWLAGKNSTLTINGGEFSQRITSTSDPQMDMIYTSKGVITINDGTFRSDTPKWTLNIKDGAYKDGSANIIVNGGTFVGYDPRNAENEGKGTSLVAEGVGVDANSDGNFTAVPNMAAQILDANGGSVKAYDSFTEAVEAAQDGETVKLLKNYDNFGSGIVKKSITIDLNGKTVTNNAEPLFTTLSEVTIKNGTITNAALSNAINAYSKVTLESMTITGAANSSYNLVNVRCNAEVTISKDSVLTANGSGVAVFVGDEYAAENATFKLNVYGKVIQNSNTYAISGNGSYKGTSTINIYDGAEVKSPTCVAIYQPQAGVTNIYGGLVEGKCAIGIKSGALNISGGTVRGTVNDHVLSDENSTGNGISYDGSAIIVDSRATGYAGNVKINVTGGTVESYYSNAIREIGNDPSVTQLAELKVTGGNVFGASSSTGNVTKDMLVRDISVSNVSVSGGAFNHKVPQNYCAPGFEPTQNGNPYGVKINENMAAEVLDAQGNTVGAYDTLADAITAAKNSETVKLLSDVAEAVTIPADKTITLDLNGKKLVNSENAQDDKVADADRKHTITNNGTLTIKDSVGGGIVDNVSHGRAAIYNAGTITEIKGGKFTRSVDNSTDAASAKGNSWYVIYNAENATINKISGGEFLAIGKFSSLFRSDGTIDEISGGTFTQDGFIAFKNQGTVKKISGGTFSSKEQSCIQNWGTIDEVCGGTITAGSIGIWNLSSDKYAAPGKVGVISGGSISGTTAAIRLTDYDNTPDGGNKPSTTCKASASITGGTITGALDVRENTKLTISGGTFDRPIDSKYCASGFVPKANSDGTYGVTRPSSGSSSSSSYDPTYSVSTPSKTEHGSVTVSPKSASKGDTVTVTVKPDSGYVLETLTVTDKNGNELTLKDKGNGKYTFTMPAGKVEVKATFMEDNSMLNFFYDVPNGAYFYEAVKWAVENGITTGVGNDLFAPEQPCTRAQIVTFLWRAAGSPEPKGTASGMTDVVSGSYYEKAVAWAIENGITTGTTTSTFSPDATCTRAQAVTFLARALKAKAASAAEFSDVPNDSYFADAVAWAAANGVTEGIGGGLFGSDNDCTRGQIVTFLYRAYNK